MISYTYECNVTCRNCRQAIAGEVASGPEMATAFAKNRATAAGWRFITGFDFGDFWLCPLCSRKSAIVAVTDGLTHVLGVKPVEATTP